MPFSSSLSLAREREQTLRAQRTISREARSACAFFCAESAATMQTYGVVCTEEERADETEDVCCGNNSTSRPHGAALAREGATIVAADVLSCAETVAQVQQAGGKY